MQSDRIPPNRLIYETAAVLSVRTSTCLPNSSGRNCRKARCPEAACPLHVAPQPVLEVSVVTTVCRDNCSGSSPAQYKGKVRPGAEGAATLLGDVHSKCTCGAIPTLGLGSVVSAEVVSYEATRAA